MKHAALAAAGAVTALALAACSQATAPSPAHSDSGTVSHPPAPVSCSKLYHTWEYGPGKGLVAALSAVSSAETGGKEQALMAALKKAAPAVARAAHYPMPSCADPKGYWGALLMHVNAAASSTGSASSLTQAMKGVPKLERQLLVELQHPTG